MAFYTTWIFKLERLVLKWVVSRPSTDVEAAQLASGARDSFAAWRVEERADRQLLMSDLLGNTRSWLMIAADNSSSTRLYFGSAVVGKKNHGAGRRSLGWRFRALMGFHQLYSRALLHSARSRLQSRSRR